MGQPVAAFQATLHDSRYRSFSSISLPQKRELLYTWYRYRFAVYRPSFCDGFRLMTDIGVLRQIICSMTKWELVLSWRRFFLSMAFDPFLMSVVNKTCKRRGGDVLDSHNPPSTPPKARHVRVFRYTKWVDFHAHTRRGFHATPPRCASILGPDGTKRPRMLAWPP